PPPVERVELQSAIEEGDIYELALPGGAPSVQRRQGARDSQERGTIRGQWYPQENRALPVARLKVRQPESSRDQAIVARPFAERILLPIAADRAENQLGMTPAQGRGIQLQARGVGRPEAVDQDVGRFQQLIQVGHPARVSQIEDRAALPARPGAIAAEAREG